MKSEKGIKDAEIPLGDYTPIFAALKNYETFNPRQKVAFKILWLHLMERFAFKQI